MAASNDVGGDEQKRSPGSLERLRAALFPWTQEVATPDDERAFAERRRERLDAYARLSAAVVAAYHLIAFVADPWALRDLPQARAALSTSRLTIAACTCLFLFFPRRFLPRRIIAPFFTLTSAVAFFLSTHAYAALGGPEQGWIHLSYAVPYVTTLVPLRLGPRILVTDTIAAAALAGMFVGHPEHLASPMTGIVVAHMAGMTGFSLVVGHFIVTLHRHTFMQSQELKRRAATIAAHERVRIARDLHDSLGQELSALRYTLTHTKARFEQSPAMIGPNLDELDRLLVQTSATTRGLLTHLRPAVLDGLGFAPAVEYLLAECRERSELAIELELRGDVSKVGADRGAAVYRILQESLTNVVRHANARRAVVVIEINADAIELRVEDDGAGFDPAGRVRGLGIVGMRERAGELGGALEIDRRPEGGTVVRCHLPAERREASA